jgi:hypothetical protein
MQLHQKESWNYRLSGIICFSQKCTSSSCRTSEHVVLLIEIIGGDRLLHHRPLRILGSESASQRPGVHRSTPDQHMNNPAAQLHPFALQI